MLDLLLGYGYYFVYSVHQNFSVKSFFYKEILHKLTHKILRSLGRQFGLGSQTPHANKSYVFLTSSHFSFPPLPELLSIVLERGKFV